VAELVEAPSPLRQAQGAYSMTDFYIIIKLSLNLGVNNTAKNIRRMINKIVIPAQVGMTMQRMEKECIYWDR